MKFGNLIRLMSRFISIIFIGLVLSACSELIIEKEDYPQWWEYIDVSHISLTTKQDVLDYWSDTSSEKVLTDMKRLQYKREFFKASFAAIKAKTLTEDGIVAALSLMPDEKIDSELRRKVYQYHLKHYWDYEDNTEDCDRCAPGDSIAIAVIGMSDVYAWYDNNKTLAVKLIHKLIEDRRLELSSDVLILVYKQAADIYWKRGMGGLDRAFMSEGHERIVSLPASLHGEHYEKYIPAYHRLSNMCC